MGLSNNKQVDNDGIVIATKSSMKKSLDKINYDYALIDSVDLMIDKPYFNFNKADSISVSVAAASIIAKVCRDSLMSKYMINYILIISLKIIKVMDLINI